MPHNFPCDWRAGFIPSASTKNRIGYLTAFEGLGLHVALPADLQVICPFGPAIPAYLSVNPLGGQIQAVAVLDNVSWNGGVGDPFSISCYMSAANANQLKALAKMALKTTGISKIGWWVGNYDVGSAQWFEQHYPKSPVNPVAQINAPTSRDMRLHVADEPEKVATNIDVNLYNVYFEVVPAANQTASFLVADSPSLSVIKPWGLKVGALGLGL